MTPNSSTKALGRHSDHLIEFEEDQLRDTHLVECDEESYRPSRTPSKAGGGIEEWSRDSFLRSRDEWAINRARDVRQAVSISFKTYSEDTASITALNGFYTWRIFEGFKAEHRDEKELEIGMIQGSRDFGTYPRMWPRLRSVICAESFVMRKADESVVRLTADAQSPESDWSEE
jgi:hypothetical protein